MSRLRIDAIVPSLDEAAALRGALDALWTAGVDRVWVVDGGSTDSTIAIARDAGATALIAPRGRARQLQRGAQAAIADGAEALWFVHADTRVPPGAGAAIRRTLRCPQVTGGAFRLRTVAPDAPRWLRPLLPLADLRSARGALPYGDQAIFARREAFEAVGGVPEQPLFEDLELVTRLRERGRCELLPLHVTASGRRFVARPLYYLLVMNLFPALYRAGVPLEQLARRYPPVR